VAGGDEATVGEAVNGFHQPGYYIASTPGLYEYCHHVISSNGTGKVGSTTCSAELEIDAGQVFLNGWW